MLQVEVLLECGDPIIVSIESVLEIPKIGMVVRCAKHEKPASVMKVGLPYRVEREVIPENDNQRSILGDDNG